MTPATIIQQAAAEGVILAPTPAGTIKATGNGDAVTRWLPVIREHKAELLAELKTANDAGYDALPPSAEARRQQVTELTRLMKMYADHNGFSQADYDEAIDAALRNVEGWLVYLMTQSECKSVQ